MISLPMVNIQKKNTTLLFAYLFFCVFYTLTGRFHFWDPIHLGFSSWDQQIPFVAETVWVYQSQLLFLGFSLFVIQKPIFLTRTLYSMGLASLIAFLVFFIFPTELPRLPIEGNDLTASNFRFLYWVDSSSNCFPSLHVALASLASYGLLKERLDLGIVSLSWAALICLSTLTTKQHSLFDVSGGFALAFICRLLVDRIELK